MLPKLPFAAGFDWLEAVLPLLFLFIWILSQVAAFVRRIARGASRMEQDDDDEVEVDLAELLLGERNGSRQCPTCGTNFAAPAAAHASCPECGRLTAATDPDHEAQEATFSSASSNKEIAALSKRLKQNLNVPRQPAALPVPPPVPPLPVRTPVLRSRSTEKRQRTNPQLSMQPPMRGEADIRKAGGISQHVHDVFDKELAHLPEGVVESPWADLDPNAESQAQSGTAEQLIHSNSLAIALANPATIRQAIVLREVLDRPIERWQ